MKTTASLALIAAAVAIGLVMLWPKSQPGKTPNLTNGGTSDSKSDNLQCCETPVEQLTRTENPARAPAFVSTDDSRRLASQLQEALASTDFETRVVALTNLLPILLAANTSLAVELANSVTNSEVRNEVLRQLARLWAAQDLPGALDWCMAMPEKTEQESALTDICLAVADVDVTQAIKLRERLFEDKPDSELESLAQRWAEKDFSAAFNWAAEKPVGTPRDQLMARLAYAQSQTAPEDAADMILKEIPAGDAQNEAVMSVIHQWAMRDVPSVTRWVNMFPEGVLRERAAQELDAIIKNRQQASNP